MRKLTHRTVGRPCSAGSEEWRVVDYRCNYSAFSGYRRTPSDYSLVQCTRCRTSWRTRAKYVEQLRRGELR